ncbi:MAG: hypothetical protein AB7E37_05760 [Candidatus Altimarinota bacterium]
MKNPFRYLGEKYAYFQAYLDDTVHYTTKKLQEKSNDTKDVSNEKVGKKILHYTGVGLSKSFGEAFSGFYEKYAELKKGENLAQTTFEEDLPKIKLKTKLLTQKMKLLHIKKGNLEDLRKLKD